MFEGSAVKDILIVLALAGIVVPILGRRFGIIPAFILAGVLVGPGGLGHLASDVTWLKNFTFSDPQRVRSLAEFGVVFLLFVIGLDTSIARLWRMRNLVFGLGAVQFIGSAAAISVLLHLVMDWAGAITIGLAFALSSTAIGSQVLVENGRLNTRSGNVSVAILLFQDVMVVPIIIVVGLLSGENIRPSMALLRAAAIAIGTVGAIVLLERYLVRPLMRQAAATGSRDLVVAIALFLAIGTAALTASVGLTAALGAFLAGILLSESEYRHQVEVDLDPFKGLLLGTFFISVGMSIDVPNSGRTCTDRAGAGRGRGGHQNGTGARRRADIRPRAGGCDRNGVPPGGRGRICVRCLYNGGRPGTA